MEVMVSEVDVDATPTRARRPHTPTPAPAPAPIDSSSSPSPYDVSTPSPSPSPSIQHYSSVLRETMRKHYDEAYKRMTTSGGKGMMAVDLSWDDEDPIDRHVRMAAYKQQAEAKRQAAAAEASASAMARASLPPMDTDPMLGKAGPSSSRLDHGLPPARPTLLDFRGFSHLSDHSVSAANDDTPGSIASEASFEAASTEDWADMYGAMTPGVVTGNADRSRSSDLIATRMSLASISTDSTITSHSTATVPMPLHHTQSHDQGLGYAQPLPTPLPCSALASGYFAIPTQTLPAPISRPYGKRPTLGTRQRSRNHPYAHAVERQKELSREEVPPIPIPDPSPGVEELYPERSESEMMVLRAGLRSQRTRVGSRL